MGVYSPSTQTITDLVVVTVDDTTVELDGGVLQLKAGGVDTTHLADGAVQTAKIDDAQVTAAKLDATLAARVPLRGTVDPSDGAGLAATPGTVYQRNADGADGGEAWVKTGDADAGWTELATV